MKPGIIGWVDITVPDAGPLRDFYSAVAGWEPHDTSQGEYDDYTMMNGGEAVAGVCHKRGENADLPGCWMIYITVTDLEKSIAEVESRGGKVLKKGKVTAVIEDPTGAVCSLFEVEGDAAS